MFLGCVSTHTHRHPQAIRDSAANARGFARHEHRLVSEGLDSLHIQPPDLHLPSKRIGDISSSGSFDTDSLCFSFGLDLRRQCLGFSVNLRTLSLGFGRRDNTVSLGIGLRLEINIHQLMNLKEDK